MIPKIGVVMGILGAGLVAAGEPLLANIIWLIGNPLLMYHNYKNDEAEQSVMFTIYFIIAIIGVINLW